MYHIPPLNTTALGMHMAADARRSKRSSHIGGPLCICLRSVVIISDKLKHCIVGTANFSDIVN